MTVWFRVKCLGFKGCKEPVVAVALSIFLSGPACTDSIFGGAGFHRSCSQVGGGGKAGCTIMRNCENLWGRDI